MTASRVPTDITRQCLRLLQSGCYTVSSSADTCGYRCGPLGVAVKANLKADYQREMVTHQNNIFPISLPADSLTLASSSGAKRLHTAEHSQVSGILRSYEGLLHLFPGMTPLGILCSGVEKYSPSEHLHDNHDSNVFQWVGHQEMFYFYHFVPPWLSQKWLDSWQRKRLDWFKKFSNAPSSFSIADKSLQTQGANSNGSNHELHVQYASQWGAETIETITTYDEGSMRELGSQVGVKLEVKSGHKKTFLPHMIEISTSLDKVLLAFLHDAFLEKMDHGEVKEFLTLHPKLAPYLVAIVTSTGSDDLRVVADYLIKEFRQIGIMTLDYKHPDAGLEEQIRSHDKIGIPYTLILDEKTLDVGVAQLRSRDTTINEPVHVTEVKQKLLLLYEAS